MVELEDMYVRPATLTGSNLEGATLAASKPIPKTPPPTFSSSALEGGGGLGDYFLNKPKVNPDEDVSALMFQQHNPEQYQKLVEWEEKYPSWQQSLLNADEEEQWEYFAEAKKHFVNKENPYDEGSHEWNVFRNQQEQVMNAEMQDMETLSPAYKSYYEEMRKNQMGDWDESIHGPVRDQDKYDKLWLELQHRLDSARTRIDYTKGEADMTPLGPVLRSIENIKPTDYALLDYYNSKGFHLQNWEDDDFIGQIALRQQRKKGQEQIDNSHWQDDYNMFPDYYLDNQYEPSETREDILQRLTQKNPDTYGSSAWDVRRNN